jgi:hypothetical protein
MLGGSRGWPGHKQKETRFASARYQSSLVWSIVRCQFLHKGGKRTVSKDVPGFPIETIIHDRKRKATGRGLGVQPVAATPQCSEQNRHPKAVEGEIDKLSSAPRRL